MSHGDISDMVVFFLSLIRSLGLLPMLFACPVRARFRHLDPLTSEGFVLVVEFCLASAFVLGLSTTRINVRRGIKVELGVVV